MPQLREVKISIETINAAFENRTARNYEIARVLRDLAKKFERCELPGEQFYLKDHNGNDCGECLLLIVEKD